MSTQSKYYTKAISLSQIRTIYNQFVQKWFEVINRPSKAFEVSRN
jgi:hypothetical protein